jgi:hypothetical protein
LDAIRSRNALLEVGQAPSEAEGRCIVRLRDIGSSPKALVPSESKRIVAAKLDALD